MIFLFKEIIDSVLSDLTGIRPAKPKPATDTYDKPPHGWTCFFCGDTFTTPGSARDHFGGELGSTAACRIKAGEERGLLMELRKVEKELSTLQARVLDEDTDKDREIASLKSDHYIALRREEEKGYARGVTDGIQYAKTEFLGEAIA